MAQSYTRQSTFVDGDTITAALFNDEYNQLENAFTYSSSSASTTGHRHDGTAGHGGNVHTIGDLDFLNKIVADSTNNRWGFFVEVSSSAVEQIRIQDGAIVPVTDNDIDLGTSSLEFKDLFIDGTAHVDTLDVDANGTVAGTFGVTGATTLSSTLAVTGALTATTKSFDIEHPTKEGMRLHHGSLEGPEHGVYIRGRLEGNEIDLPDYWLGLVDEDTITVQLTPNKGFQQIYVENISDNKVYVGTQSDKPIDCFYFIQAERKDIDRMEVEY